MDERAAVARMVLLGSQFIVGPPGVERPRQTNPGVGAEDEADANAGKAVGNEVVTARAAGRVGADASGVAVAAADRAAEAGPAAAMDVDGSPTT